MGTTLKDFVKSTLASGIDASTTSVTLSSGTDFPGPTSEKDQYWVTIWNSTAHSDPADDSDAEEVRVRSKSGAVLTVARGEGTATAAAHNTGGVTYSVAILGSTKNLTNIASYNPISFGAVGNGSTNDTTAMSNCALAAGANGRIFLPPDLNFRVTASISNIASGQTWFGGGTISVAAGTVVPFALASSLTEVTFSGIKFAATATMTAGSAISADNTVTKLRIENCSFNLFYASIDSSASDSWIVNNVITNSVIQGIKIGTHASRCSITGNEIKTVNGASAYGIDLNGSSANPNNDVVVSNNMVSSCVDASGFGVGIQFRYAVNLSISNNVIQTAGLGGIVQYGTDSAATDTCSISGNTIKTISHATGYGIYLALGKAVCSGNIISAAVNIGIYCNLASVAATHKSISGNSIIASAVGIKLDGVTHNMVAGNTIQGSTTDGIVLTADADYNHISGNLVAASTRYGIYLENGADHTSIESNSITGSGTNDIREHTTSDASLPVSGSTNTWQTTPISRSVLVVGNSSAPASVSSASLNRNDVNKIAAFYDESGNRLGYVALFTNDTLV